MKRARITMQTHPHPFGRRLGLAALCCVCLGVSVVRSYAGPAAAASPGTVEILVAHYSLTENTERMAGGVVQGIKRVDGVTVNLKKVEDVTRADLDKAKGIVLGCPTYYGNIPGKMKVALDDWSWKMKADLTDKIGGAFSTGGGQAGGKEFVVMSLLVFMLQNRMIVAGPLYQNDTTGSVWGELGASAITGPLHPGVNHNDLDGAERLGEGVAQLAWKLASNIHGVQAKP